MPERLTRATRFETDEVQGEGSYVVMRGFTGAELLDTPDGADWQTYYQEPRHALQALVHCIVEWNWVDDAGEPLPLPSEDEEVVRGLTLDEIAALMRLFQRVTSTARAG